jgi:HEAT repeat protein
VLHRALEGLHYGGGVQPYLVTEARLGEAIERLWDHRPEGAQPLLARVAVETLRLLRRAPHARALVPEEAADREAFDLQMSRLTVLEPVLTDYLEEAPAALRAALAQARGQDLKDLLQALCDLRAEAGCEVLELLAGPSCPQAELAVELLTWSREPRVGPWLRAWMGRQVQPVRRAQWRRQPRAPRSPSVPAEIPYRAALRALRGHPSAETERFLLQAACDWDPTYRAAALGSLGWWEPLRPAETLGGLQQARRDPSPEVRQAARAALARLGERQALQWFRQALTGEEAHRVEDAIQVVAAEGLTLLWPDLDRLADAEDQDIAQRAREALERMSEEMEKRRG